MSSIKRALNYIHYNRAQFLDSTVKHLGFLFGDKLYISLRYRFLMGKWIDWSEPKTFTEKIQWLKVYGFKPEYTTMVDKLAAKDYVANLIGNEYIIPTLQVWDSTKEIDIDKLPSRFVLKTTHGGGGCGVVICKDKTLFERDKSFSKLQISMNCVVGKEFRERPYYLVHRKIFAEQFMAEDDTELIDYKFYCFNGEPTYCQVIRDRNVKETIDFYDMDWNLMPFVGLNPKCDNGPWPLPKPECLDKMINISKILSKNIPFARIDLYNFANHPFFGEITLYPGGGIGRFKPAEWDVILGSLIQLPK